MTIQTLSLITTMPRKINWDAVEPLTEAELAAANDPESPLYLSSTDEDAAQDARND